MWEEPNSEHNDQFIKHYVTILIIINNNNLLLLEPYLQK